MTSIEQVIEDLEDYRDREYIKEGITIFDADPRYRKLIMNRAITYLKQKEPIKPVLDEKTGRAWLCGNCGEYVGFEDHDETDPNEFDNYCRKCGRPVKWDKEDVK